jgi:hypothetical protein
VLPFPPGRQPRRPARNEPSTPRSDLLRRHRERRDTRTHRRRASAAGRCACPSSRPRARRSSNPCSDGAICSRAFIRFDDRLTVKPARAPGERRLVLTRLRLAQPPLGGKASRPSAFRPASGISQQPARANACSGRRPSMTCSTPPGTRSIIRHVPGPRCSGSMMSAPMRWLRMLGRAAGSCSSSSLARELTSEARSRADVFGSRMRACRSRAWNRCAHQRLEPDQAPVCARSALARASLLPRAGRRATGRSRSAAQAHVASSRHQRPRAGRDSPRA